MTYAATLGRKGDAWKILATPKSSITEQIDAVKSSVIAGWSEFDEVIVVPVAMHSCLYRANFNLHNPKELADSKSKLEAQLAAEIKAKAEHQLAAARETAKAAAATVKELEKNLPEDPAVKKEKK